MNNFNKVLIATVASFMTSGIEAKAIHNSCLKLSDQMVGQETGEYFSNEDQLTGSTVHDEMKLDSFTTCTGADGYFTGLQFLFSLNPYDMSNEDDFIEMGAFGKTSGDGIECQTLNIVESGLDRIRASSTGADTGVNNIRYYRGNRSKYFGDKDQKDSVQWKFSEEDELVGVYGRQSERGIEQLGFITLDTACQAAAEETKPVDEEEETDNEKTIEFVQPEDLQKPEIVEEEQSGILFGLDMLTLIIIGAGIVVFLLLLIVTICACKAKNKKNEQNKIVIMSNDPTSTPVTSKAKQNKVRELKPVDQTDHESNINTPADFSDKTRATMSNKVSSYPELATIDNGDKSNDV